MNWYESKTGNHQGLVIDEADGRNVAVVYDKKDAPLIAAAPALLAALRGLLAHAEYLERCLHSNCRDWDALAPDAKAARAALALAEGRLA